MRPASKVAAGNISAELMESILKRIQLNHAEGRRSRENMIWFTSTPYSNDDGGVGYFVKYWGGEVAHMGWNDEELNSIFQIGRARVLEVAIPLEIGDNDYSAADAAVKSYSRKIGCEVSIPFFDFNIKQALPASSILGIHTEGDAAYEVMGNAYQGTEFPNIT